MKKNMFMLLITLILSGCLGMEKGETEASIDEVEAITIDEGTITIGKTENELILNEEGYEGIPLLEYANQLSSIVTSPNETATIHIDNDPNVSVYLWDKYVPLKLNSFSIPYETGLYVYNIEAKWSTKKQILLQELKFRMNLSEFNVKRNLMIQMHGFCRRMVKNK